MRAESGEEISITVDGRTVGSLVLIGGGKRWIPRAEFLQLVQSSQADPALLRSYRASSQTQQMNCEHSLSRRYTVLHRYSCSTHNLNGDVDGSHCKLIN